jgi:hypothetical protein
MDLTLLSSCCFKGKNYMTDWTVLRRSSVIVMENSLRLNVLRSLPLSLQNALKSLNFYSESSTGLCPPAAPFADFTVSIEVYSSSVPQVTVEIPLGEVKAPVVEQVQEAPVGQAQVEDSVLQAPEEVQVLQASEEAHVLQAPEAPVLQALEAPAELVVAQELLSLQALAQAAALSPPISPPRPALRLSRHDFFPMCPEDPKFKIGDLVTSSSPGVYRVVDVDSLQTLCKGDSEIIYSYMILDVNARSRASSAYTASEQSLALWGPEYSRRGSKRMRDTRAVVQMPPAQRTFSSVHNLWCECQGCCQIEEEDYTGEDEE